MPSLRFSAVSAVVFVALVSSCAAYQFYLDAHRKKCFHEDLPLNTNARFTYTVTQGDGEMPVSLRVTDLARKVIYDKQNVDHDVFSFQTLPTIPGVRERRNWALTDDDSNEDDEGYYRAMSDGAGDDRSRYVFCFSHSSALHLPRLGRHGATKRKILFRVDAGSNTKTQEDYDKLAKESHLSSTEELFKVVEDRVGEVIGLIDEMRQRELRMEHLNNKTSNTVTMYCTFSCICIALGALYASQVTFKQLSKKRSV